MPRKSTTQPTLSKEEVMQKQIEELQAKIETMMSKKEDQPVSKISSDDDVPVMSLSIWPMTLMTKKYGKGEEYEFSHFGEIKNIIYSHLSGIIEANRSFVEAPYFYIMDERVVKRHGLADLYSKILKKDQIDKILDCDSKTAVALYKSAPKRQQEIIVESLIRKIYDGYEVDMNIVNDISREAKVDIMDKVKRAKEFSESEE